MDYVFNVIKGRWDKIDDLHHMHDFDYITLVVDTTNERVPEILENSILESDMVIEYVKKMEKILNPDEIKDLLVKISKKYIVPILTDKEWDFEEIQFPEYQIDEFMNIVLKYLEKYGVWKEIEFIIPYIQMTSKNKGE